MRVSVTRAGDCNDDTGNNLTMEANNYASIPRHF